MSGRGVGWWWSEQPLGLKARRGLCLKGEQERNLALAGSLLDRGWLGLAHWGSPVSKPLRRGGMGAGCCDLGRRLSLDTVKGRTAET